MPKQSKNKKKDPNMVEQRKRRGTALASVAGGGPLETSPTFSANNDPGLIQNNTSIDTLQVGQTYKPIGQKAAGTELAEMFQSGMAATTAGFQAYGTVQAVKAQKEREAERVKTQEAREAADKDKQRQLAMDQELQVLNDKMVEAEKTGSPYSATDANFQRQRIMNRWGGEGMWNTPEAYLSYQQGLTKVKLAEGEARGSDFMFDNVNKRMAEINGSSMTPEYKSQAMVDVVDQGIKALEANPFPGWEREKIRLQGILTKQRDGAMAERDRAVQGVVRSEAESISRGFELWTEEHSNDEDLYGHVPPGEDPMTFITEEIMDKAGIFFDEPEMESDFRMSVRRQLAPKIEEMQNKIESENLKKISVKISSDTRADASEFASRPSLTEEDLTNQAWDGMAANLKRLYTSGDGSLIHQARTVAGNVIEDVVHRWSREVHFAETSSTAKERRERALLYLDDFFETMGIDIEAPTSEEREFIETQRKIVTRKEWDIMDAAIGQMDIHTLEQLAITGDEGAPIAARVYSESAAIEAGPLVVSEVARHTLATTRAMVDTSMGYTVPLSRQERINKNIDKNQRVPRLLQEVFQAPNQATMFGAIIREGLLADGPNFESIRESFTNKDPMPFGLTEDDLNEVMGIIRTGMTKNPDVGEFFLSLDSLRDTNFRNPDDAQRLVNAVEALEDGHRDPASDKFAFVKPGEDAIKRQEWLQDPMGKSNTLFADQTGHDSQNRAFMSDEDFDRQFTENLWRLGSELDVILGDPNMPITEKQEVVRDSLKAIYPNVNLGDQIENVTQVLADFQQGAPTEGEAAVKSANTLRNASTLARDKIREAVFKSDVGVFNRSLENSMFMTSGGVAIDISPKEILENMPPDVKYHLARGLGGSGNPLTREDLNANLSIKGLMYDDQMQLVPTPAAKDHTSSFVSSNDGPGGGVTVASGWAGPEGLIAERLGDEGLRERLGAAYPYDSLGQSYVQGYFDLLESIKDNKSDTLDPNKVDSNGNLTPKSRLVRALFGGSRALGSNISPTQMALVESMIETGVDPQAWRYVLGGAMDPGNQHAFARGRNGDMTFRIGNESLRDSGFELDSFWSVASFVNNPSSVTTWDKRKQYHSDKLRYDNQTSQRTGVEFRTYRVEDVGMKVTNHYSDDNPFKLP